MVSESESYKLTPAQRLYCVARAEGQTKKDAAKVAGVAEQTVHEWHKDSVKGPALDAEIDRLLDEFTADVKRHFKAHVMRAARRITDCIEGGQLRHGNAVAVNLQAAQLTLKHAGLEPATKQQIGGDPDNPAPLTIERVIFKGE